MGSIVVEYVYDAWGKPLAVTGTLAATLGAANPMRYRGYYWDAEIGFYYLQSRYYNPEWGRFISADEPIMLGLSDNILGTNLFAYCGNNPVMRIDLDGQLPRWLSDFLRGIKDGFKGSYSGFLNAFLHPFQSIRSILATKNLIKNVFDPFNFWQISWNLVKGRFYNAGFLYGQNLFSAAVFAVTYGIGRAFKVISGRLKPYQSRGHSAGGRLVAKNLKEQLAMREVQSNPLVIVKITVD
jgi:RHS repeat-associated protein